MRGLDRIDSHRASPARAAPGCSSSRAPTWTSPTARCATASSARARACREDIDRVFIRKEDDARHPGLRRRAGHRPRGHRRLQPDPERGRACRSQRLDGVAVGRGRWAEREGDPDRARPRAHRGGRAQHLRARRSELAGDNFTLASGNVRDGRRRSCCCARSRATATSTSWPTGRGRVRAIRRLSATGGRDIARLIASVRGAGARLPRARDEQAGGGDRGVQGRRRQHARGRRRRSHGRGRAAWRPTRASPASRSCTLFDQGEVIEESLGTLVDSGPARRLSSPSPCCSSSCAALRMTLIIALAIPLSLLIALTVDVLRRRDAQHDLAARPDDLASACWSTTRSSSPRTSTACTATACRARRGVRRAARARSRSRSPWRR